MIPERTLARLTLYRRIVADLLQDKLESVHSHQLALRAGATAAQVRRDLMVIGAEGSPKRGYKCAKLAASLGRFLDVPGGQKVALIGVGNLGRALLSYFMNRHPGLQIVAAFDSDNEKAGSVILGCRCYHLDEIEQVIKNEGIKVAVIAVPAGSAQFVADRVALAGVKGILNFAPVALHLPPSVFGENIDVTMSLEKVAFFAAKRT